jgi:dolichol-phosphate mannosyltransferase
MTTLEFTPPRRRLIDRALHHGARTKRRAARAVQVGAPELRTLIKFGVVGGSGYIVNLGVFALVESMGSRHFVAATLAFLGAVVNNFHWNRKWTFNAVGKEAVHRQAHRFMVVSVIGFVFSLGVLELLINLGAKPIIGQAISIAAAMPFAFVANRVWTFAAPGALKRHYNARRARRAERV